MDGEARSVGETIPFFLPCPRREKKGKEASCVVTECLCSFISQWIFLCKRKWLLRRHHQQAEDRPSGYLEEGKQRFCCCCWSNGRFANARIKAKKPRRYASCSFCAIKITIEDDGGSTTDLSCLALSSTHGTYVDGKELSVEATRICRPGSEVCFGTGTATFTVSKE